MGFSDTDPRFRPNLGTGGAPMGGPRYHFDPNLDSDRKFPAFYDDKWFIAEWNNGWIKTANLGPTGAMTAVDPFALGTGYRRPMDLDFGPDGALYVIEWGSGFGGDNADSGVYRDRLRRRQQGPDRRGHGLGDQRPRAARGAVQLSTGSSDPEGGPITYAWDFDSDGTVDSTAANPSHTYTTNGAYTAKLTVKDEGGLSGVENILITVGNRAPTVTIETPLNGKLASFTDKIPYKVTVTDPEDGTPARASTATTSRSKISLGHDEHAHDLSSVHGCEGTLSTGLAAGHGPEANTFTVISVCLHRQGRRARPLTGRAEAILQPKQKQAEFFASTGRVPDGDDRRHRRRADGDHHRHRGRRLEHRLHRGRRLHVLQAVQPDGHRRGALPGGERRPGRHDRAALRLADRPAAGQDGDDHADRQLADVQERLAAADGLPTGTHELFVITRNPGQTASLLNLNWIDFVGKGAAQTAAPEVTSTATPLTGAAPLPVKFETTATDPDGGTLAYAWDFGVPGTTTDTSTRPRRRYTYANQGNYTATLTVTDGQGGTTVKTFAIRVTAAAGCGTRTATTSTAPTSAPAGTSCGATRGWWSPAATLKIPTGRATSTAATTTPRTSCCARRRPARGPSPRRSSTPATASTTRRA